MQFKDPIQNQEKSCIVYKFNCFFDKSYIGQTSRHLKTRTKEHLLICVIKFIEKEPKIMTRATENATKRSSIAEHLVKNRECAKKYDLSIFKILHQCNNVTDLIKMEAVLIYLDLSLFLSFI